jgi:membrane-associated phospholipid phosphatase
MMSIEGLDTQVLLLINNGLANSSLDTVMISLSDRGYLLFLPYLFYMLIRGWSGRANADASLFKWALLAVLISTCSFIMADALADLLKPVFGRIRPCQAVQGLRLVVRCPHSFSMPSGHAISSFAAATALFYLPRYFVPILVRSYPLVLAAAVALSRVYLGVHYPSDVIVGAALGSTVAILFSLLCEGVLPEQLRQSSHLDKRS